MGISTAYRVIASASSNNTKDGSLHGSERGEDFPPPAYEETVRVQTSRQGVGEIADGWEELDDGVR
jgi:hypothetical protein